MCRQTFTAPQAIGIGQAKPMIRDRRTVRLRLCVPIQVVHRGGVRPPSGTAISRHLLRRMANAVDLHDGSPVCGKLASRDNSVKVASGGRAMESVVGTGKYTYKVHENWAH